MDEYTYYLPFKIVSDCEPDNNKLYDTIRERINEGWDDVKLRGMVKLISKVPVDKEKSVVLKESEWKSIINILNGWEEWPSTMDELSDEIERQVGNG